MAERAANDNASIYLGPRVLAQAIVDPIVDGMGISWYVTVEGYFEGSDPATAQKRVYTITTPDDNLAAQDGLRRFCREMEALA